MKYIFDLDGTVTSQETLPLIANHFNLQQEIHNLTRETIQGNIPFIESFIRRVHILGKLPVSEIAALVKNVKLHLQIVDFIQTHKEKCIIASGNLDCWIKPLTDEIGCEYYYSTALVKGDRAVSISSIINKESIVKKYQDSGEKIIFIGDGNNDMEAMRISDVGIAVGLIHYPAKSILPFADYLIFNESALCRQLNQLL